MNDNAEYDLLLRSVFDSCNSTGSGLLSPTEFQELCTQLCLEDEHSLLERVLFAESCTSLSYERFRECLLLLLAGTLTEDEYLQSPSDRNGVVQHCRSGSAGLSASEEECTNLHQEEINSNEQLAQSLEARGPSGLTPRSGRSHEKDAEYERNAEDSKWLLIDYENNIEDKNVQDEESFRLSLPAPQAANKKYRRYGRKSAPDLDLLKSNSWSNRNLNLYTSPPVPSNPVQYDVTRSPGKRTVLPTPIAEELTGEGNGGHWVTPNFLDEQHQEDQFDELESPVDPQEALKTIWRNVIGDPEEKIDVEQLQHLYRAQSLTSSGGDVRQLFEVLDTDDDGLISFSDFARQMSAHVSDDARDLNNDTYNVSDRDCDEDNLQANRPSPSSTAHAPTHSPADMLSQPNPPNIRGQILQPTPVETSFTKLPMTGSHVMQSDRDDNRIAVTPSNVTSSPIANVTPSPLVNVTSSPIANMTSPPVANDVNSSNSDDGMRRYHGVPSYRRKRRFSQHPSRRHNHRRRNNRTMSLPHYHPISMQNLEECLLYFLTEENGRYVNMDEIQRIWREEGIEDEEQVMKDLGVDLDDSFSIEVISEAFETAMRENVVHQAIYAVYKHGIKYHRSEKEMESAKRRKTESMLEHLNTQLQEQEERIDKMEHEHYQRLTEAENNFKEQLVEYSKHLDGLHSSNRVRNEEEVEKLNSRIKQLEEIEAKLLDELREARSDNKQLLLRNNKAEIDLHNAEQKLETLQSDFHAICYQTTLFNQIHARQQSKMEILFQEYRDGAQLLRDSNDELVCQLETMKKRWNIPEKANIVKANMMPDHRSDTASSSQTNPTPQVSNGLSFLPLPSGARGFSSSSYTDLHLPPPKEPSSDQGGRPTSPNNHFRTGPHLSGASNLLNEVKNSPRSGLW